MTKFELTRDFEQMTPDYIGNINNGTITLVTALMALVICEVIYPDFTKIGLANVILAGAKP